MAKQASWHGLLRVVPDQYAVAEVWVNLFMGIRLSAVSECIVRCDAAQLTFDHHPWHPEVIGQQLVPHENICLLAHGTGFGWLCVLVPKDLVSIG